MAKAKKKATKKKEAKRTPAKKTTTQKKRIRKKSTKPRLSKREGVRERKVSVNSGRGKRGVRKPPKVKPKKAQCARCDTISEGAFYQMNSGVIRWLCSTCSLRAHYKSNGMKAKRKCVHCNKRRRGKFEEDLDGVYRWTCWVCSSDDPTFRRDTEARIAAQAPFKWKPGQSGNPKGRPPKNRCFKSLMKDFLESISSHDPTMTREQVLAEAIYEHALAGNKVAMEHVLNRMYGSVKHDIAIESKEPFVVKILEVKAELEKKKKKKKSPPK